MKSKMGVLIRGNPNHVILVTTPARSDEKSAIKSDKLSKGATP